jgi:hypothetical protein
MLRIILVCLALLWAVPSWSQVAPSASGGGPGDGAHMMTPPPVSSEGYPRGVGSAERTNYLLGGIRVSASYNDNLMEGGTTSPVSDETYSILPTVALERKTPYQRESLHYDSGFTIYQNRSELNSIAQSAMAKFEYRFTPYLTLSLRDSLLQNSNAFSQPNPSAGGAVSGSGQSLPGTLLFPFQKQLANSTNASISYQYSNNAMLGGGGSYSFLHYSDLAQVTGPYNDGTSGGSGFYSRRLTPSQYLGGAYQYFKTVTHPVSSSTTTQAIALFYTMYFNRTFSLSVLFGPQHLVSVQPQFPRSSSWTPEVMASVGWQRSTTNFAAGYTRIVRGGVGLLGAFHTDNATASAEWQMKRTWSSGMEGSYAIFKTAVPFQSALNQGGHTLTGTVSVHHSIRERLSVEAGYSHLHQSYGAIPQVSSFPDSNRAFGAINYYFSRPLGR